MECISFQDVFFFLSLQEAIPCRLQFYHEISDRFNVNITMNKLQILRDLPESLMQAPSVELR